MTKYHINKRGEPAVCKAKSQPCPLGEHFDNEADANKYIQNKMETEFGIISKSENTNNLIIEYEKQLQLVKDGKFKDLSHEEEMRTRLAEMAKMKGGDSEEVELGEVLSSLHSPDSGATMSIKSSKKAISPTTGFCASPYPQHSKVFDNPKEVTFAKLQEFMNNIIEIDKDIFEEDETYIGFWNDPQTGKIYLDISKRYHTAQEARIACEQNDQIAYFDLQTFESVDVDRNAKSGQIQGGE